MVLRCFAASAFVFCAGVVFLSLGNRGPVGGDGGGPLFPATVREGYGPSLCVPREKWRSRNASQPSHAERARRVAKQRRPVVLLEVGVACAAFSTRARIYIVVAFPHKHYMPTALPSALHPT